MAVQDLIPGVDLTGEHYTVKQKLVRNKYRVYDDDGELLLKAKQKLFKVKEQFPFTNADGEPVFEIKAQNLLDIAGDYAIVDPDGETLAVLKKNFTLLTHKWKVKDPDGDRVHATVTSRGVFFQLLRTIPYAGFVFQFFPHKYTIAGPEGDRLGSIEGRFSIRDVYDIEIEDDGDAPREVLVASAIAIDALEGN